MDRNYLVLSGGVGGAKLIRGLQQVVEEKHIKVIANTGDDFQYLGLHISPDIDTLMYTLAGISNPKTGWGLINESWSFHAALKELSDNIWFQIGDRDLETHIRRTELLDKGLSLSDTTRKIYQRLGIKTQIIPMSDEKVRTELETDQGNLAFQDYFVRLKAEPIVKQIRYKGASKANVSRELLAAFDETRLSGIIISPSNPWLSIEPILSVSSLKTMIVNSGLPVIAISPIVGGRAIKGPTAKLMKELGLEVSAKGIAEHYKGLIDALIIDSSDAQHADDINRIGIQTAVTQTIMYNDADKAALAEFVITFLDSLDKKKDNNYE
ncbi:MAG: 2-phospho-L-lactate transferase [Pseudomonadota bacterium]|nr:2-phospho-L-lactate transferase [Pseudomonadota bacterium]